MGSLHMGHMALVQEARANCDKVVASVFVNPTQFGPDEDYAAYPRSLQADAQALAANGCDLAFAPSVDVMYPFGPDNAVRIHVPGISDILEGARRPGHFDGVCTVVARLLHLVASDVAVFGRKDYQQWRVIQRMVMDLSLPVEIVAAPTQRETDGLALSSRNQYLTAAQREQAPALFATLQWMRDQHAADRRHGEIEQEAVQRLRQHGFQPDYAVLRRSEDLAEPDAGRRNGLVALVAAQLGDARLIDNLECG